MRKSVVLRRIPDRILKLEADQAFLIGQGGESVLPFSATYAIRGNSLR